MDHLKRIILENQTQADPFSVCLSPPALFPSRKFRFDSIRNLVEFNTLLLLKEKSLPPADPLSLHHYL